MTSPKKVAANRRNAKKSTGPRTEMGKQRTSRNALTLKIYAGPQLLPGESKAEYDALVASLAKALMPEGPIEGIYFMQIVGDMMRLKRVDVAEHGYIEWHVLDIAEIYGDSDSEQYKGFALSRVLSKIATEPPDGFEDKIDRRRKRAVRDMRASLAALQELQQRRSIDAHRRTTDSSVEKLDGPRLSIAPVDAGSQEPPESLVAEKAEPGKQSQKAA